jgi:hypothetical protein
MDGMNSCTCGHAPEEHPRGGECEGVTHVKGKDQPCDCIAYEEDDE